MTIHQVKMQQFAEMQYRYAKKNLTNVDTMWAVNLIFAHEQGYFPQS